VNFRGSGCDQRFGAFIKRGPGSVNIIDDEDAAAFDFARIWHMEGIPDIMQALCSIQARLWFRPALPDKGIELDRKTKLTSNSVGEQSRLIEASLSQTFHMKRDGEDHLHSGPCFSPEQIYQQLGKRRRPMELTSKFQLMNPFANHTRMLSCRTRAVKQE